LQNQTEDRSGERADTGRDGQWTRLPQWEGQCRKYRLQVPRGRIGYINAILEGYDGIARVETEKKQEGILALIVPPEWDEVFRAVVDTLREKVELRFL